MNDHRPAKNTSKYPEEGDPEWISVDDRRRDFLSYRQQRVIKWLVRLCGFTYGASLVFNNKNFNAVMSHPISSMINISASGSLYSFGAGYVYTFFPFPFDFAMIPILLCAAYYNVKNN